MDKLDKIIQLEIKFIKILFVLLLMIVIVSHISREIKLCYSDSHFNYGYGKYGFYEE